MNTTFAPPPRGDNSPFFVSSLNSFNRFAKGAKAAACHRLQAMKDKPKLPPVFARLTGKISTSKTSKTDKSPKTTPNEVQAAPRKRVDNKPSQKAPPEAVRQMPTPPPEPLPRRRAPPAPKVHVKAIFPPQKPQTPPKVVVVMKPRPVSPMPRSSKGQLATPPPTPPLAPTAPKKLLVAKSTVIVNVNKPLPPIPVRAPLPTRSKIPQAKKPATTAIPKRVRQKPKAIAKSVSVEEGQVVAPTFAPADIRVEAPLEAKIEEIKGKLASAPEEKRVEDVEKACSVLPTPSTETQAEKTAFVMQRALAMDELKAVLGRRMEALAKLEEPRKEVTGEATVGNGRVEASPAAVAKAGNVEYDVVRTVVPKIARKDDSACEEQKEVPATVSGGIQARMAALFDNAGASSYGPTRLEPGAYVRRLKIPQLGEDQQASRNQQIQREVEALRFMKRVGTGSHALVKTRAFGGSLAANHAVEGVEHSTGLSLESLVIVERLRRERASV